MCLAVPGKILSVSGDDPLLRMAKVSFGGVVKDVSLAYVPEADVGDYVIVHVGFALNKVDEAEAVETLALLDQLEIEAPPI
jgi:hydrogenase expression/formation protein HypC